MATTPSIKRTSMNVGSMAFAIALGMCSSKRVTSSVVLGGPSHDGADIDQWKYLSKIGFYIGTGTFAARLRAAEIVQGTDGQSANLLVELHLDEDWEEVEQMSPCERHYKARRVLGAWLPSNGRWGEWINGSVWQHVRPHIWYIALRDCVDQLPNRTRIEFEFVARQENGSEFSVELYGTLSVAIIKLVLATLFVGWFGLACREVMLSRGTLHPVIQIFGCAALAQYIAYLCHVCHLWSYRSNGQGLPGVDLIAEVCTMMSQILLTCLNIFLAQGYSLLPHTTVHVGTIVVAFIVISVSHIVLVGLAKMRDDSSFKFHENEGTLGFILVGLRVAIFLWFFISMRLSFSGAPNKLIVFLRRFEAASTLYFLAYPTLFFIASVLAPYLRHKLMLAGLFLMQAGSIVWYANLFLTRGEYFEVSTLGGNILPTPKGSRKRPALFGRAPDLSFKWE